MLAESSLECVPENLHRHPSVRAHSRRVGRPATAILLDNSWHYAAMRGIKQQEKRGRPDIVHFALLAATCSPLYRSGGMRIYVHTLHDVVVRISPDTRIPKSYHRFEGLFADLLIRGQIKTGDSTLLQAAPCTLGNLLEDVRPSGVAGMSVSGLPSSCRDIVSGLGPDPCVVIGGFQKGTFSADTRKLLDCTYSIWSHSLEAHVVVSRVVYDAENHFNGGVTS